MNIIEQLKFDSDGLIPAIAQEEKSGEILMMAWMNRESLQRNHRHQSCNVLEPFAKKVLDER